MSVYRGRTGPNFSNYLNSLNTVSPPYDPVNNFGDELLDPNSDLSIFTNTDFTSMDDATFNFDLTADDKTNTGTFENFLPHGLPAAGGNTHAQSPADSSQWYNTPIQPAPAPNFNQIDNQSSVISSTTQSRKNTDNNIITAEEKSRLAAEEDKRRRNTAASARFRVKKKQREQALEVNLKEAQDKSAKLEAKLTQLEMENKWLKELITEKNGTQSPEEIAAAYQKYRKESEERDVIHASEHTTGVGTD